MAERTELMDRMPLLPLLLIPLLAAPMLRADEAEHWLDQPLPARPSGSAPRTARYVLADGCPTVSSERVDAHALLEATYLVDLVLAKRPDLRRAMIECGSRLVRARHEHQQRAADESRSRNTEKDSN